MANPLQSILSKIWHKYAEDVGISLIHLGALGWFLSSAAQLAMIITNKDIDKKEKQFLIPQEASDGAINSGDDWILSELELWHEGTAAELAGHIASQAKKRRSDIRPDDVTVTAAIIGK